MEKEREKKAVRYLECIILLTENKEACDHLTLNVWSELCRALLQVSLSMRSLSCGNSIYEEKIQSK